MTSFKKKKTASLEPSNCIFLPFISLIWVYILQAIKTSYMVTACCQLSMHRASLFALINLAYGIDCKILTDDP